MKNVKTGKMHIYSNILGMYQNGNYMVTLYKDGTKVRENDLDNLTPDFPESCDVTITKQCDGNCKYCYEDCTEYGEHGDIMNSKFINSLHPYTELALNGNNLSHPDLVPFLEKLKSNKVVANITVNQKHFEKNRNLLKYLSDKKLIHGLGISLVKSDPVFISHVKMFPDAVIHVICGVFGRNDFQSLSNHNLKILVLGYKNRGRGSGYLLNHEKEVQSKILWMKNHVQDMFNCFKLVCFDNLALSQLDIKEQIPESTWNECYMGDDGRYTMYVDMVNRTFAKDSMSNRKYAMLDSIDDMFHVVQKELV